MCDRSCGRDTDTSLDMNVLTWSTERERWRSPSEGMYFNDVTRSRSFKKLKHHKQDGTEMASESSQLQHKDKVRKEEKKKRNVQPRLLLEPNLLLPQHLSHGRVPPQSHNIMSHGM